MKPTAGARGRALRGWWFALAAVAIGYHAAPVTHIAPDEALLARLGYPPTARLLILHADDMAMTSGVTHVTRSALRAGIVNSASMLAPPSFVDSVPTLLRAGERFDIGVHSTLTSESARLCWPPGRWTTATSPSTT